MTGRRLTSRCAGVHKCQGSKVRISSSPDRSPAATSFRVLVGCVMHTHMFDKMPTVLCRPSEVFFLFLAGFERKLDGKRRKKTQKAEKQQIRFLKVEKVGFWAKSRNFDRFGCAGPFSPTFESDLDLAGRFCVLLEPEMFFASLCHLSVDCCMDPSIPSGATGESCALPTAAYSTVAPASGGLSLTLAHCCSSLKAPHVSSSLTSRTSAPTTCRIGG